MMLCLQHRQRATRRSPAWTLPARLRVAGGGKGCGERHHREPLTLLKLCQHVQQRLHIPCRAAAGLAAPWAGAVGSSGNGGCRAGIQVCSSPLGPAAGVASSALPACSFLPFLQGPGQYQPQELRAGFSGVLLG